MLSGFSYIETYTNKVCEFCYRFLPEDEKEESKNDDNLNSKNNNNVEPKGDDSITKTERSIMKGRNINRGFGLLLGKFVLIFKKKKR